MDRIDAIKALIASVDEGSLSKAARRLGRSPAALTRTIAFLEQEVGVELLHRTTRTHAPQARPGRVTPSLVAGYWRTGKKPISRPPGPMWHPVAC